LLLFGKYDGFRMDEYIEKVTVLIESKGGSEIKIFNQEEFNLIYSNDIIYLTDNILNVIVYNLPTIIFLFNPNIYQNIIKRLDLPSLYRVLLETQYYYISKNSNTLSIKQEDISNYMDIKITSLNVYFSKLDISVFENFSENETFEELNERDCILEDVNLIIETDPELYTHIPVNFLKMLHNHEGYNLLCCVAYSNSDEIHNLCNLSFNYLKDNNLLRFVSGEIGFFISYLDPEINKEILDYIIEDKFSKREECDRFFIDGVDVDYEKIPYLCLDKKLRNYLFDYIPKYFYEIVVDDYDDWNYLYEVLVTDIMEIKFWKPYLLENKDKLIYLLEKIPKLKLYF